MTARFTSGGFNLRPSNPEDKDWSDNPVSNAMAGISEGVIPSWCNKQGHWTIHLADYLWTDCACCLIFRGIAVGGFFGVIIGVAIGTLLV